MTDLSFTVDAPVPAETVIGALTDFSERRPEIWPDLDPDLYRVDELHPTSAVVREGQRKPRLWAIEEYEWSTPGTVTWTARESNFCAPGSFMSARVEPTPGGSRMHVTWSRSGVGFKGKMIIGLMRLTRGRPLAKNLGDALAGLASPEVPIDR
ncbi:MAG TPA: SRPBCC family protein [Actinomycetota bacterium]|nr:SRPBCC family protein [Actinomycetota bacterium]